MKDPLIVVVPLLNAGQPFTKLQQAAESAKFMKRIGADLAA
jgi:hypothetical protein